MAAFLSGFCRVEFLCYQGSPNWLGWLVLAAAAITILAITGALSR